MSTRGIITTKEGTGAPLRHSPMAEAEMAGAIPSGTEVDLLGYGDGWYLVSADGLQGYVAGSMVQALDGINGLGKLKIFKKKDKNGKTTATVTATPAVVKDVAQSKGGLLSKARTAAANYAVKNNPKLQLTNAIRAAKKAGVTEAEIKEMASLNGIGSLLDTLKNAGNKVVNAAKKVVGAKEKVDTVKEALNQPTTTTTTTTPAAQTPAPATQQPVVVVQQPQTQNINPQNNTTMDDEKKSKIKKIAIAGAALLGVATIGVIAYKKSKKNAAANGKGALNGVKRRKKSRKSKKNTGNKMLHLS